MSDNGDSMSNDNETDDTQAETWLPRRSVRDMNWMYGVDALRTHGHREMEVQLYQSLALLCNAVRALAYALSFRYIL